MERPDLSALHAFPTAPPARFVPLEDLADFELVPGSQDPSRYTVIGARDFVLGTVTRLLVDTTTEQIAYLVVNTRISNFPEGRGEERLVPVAWSELVGARRQVRLPHLAWYAFRQLPIYAPNGAIPERIEFPRPFEDEDLRDIA